MFYIPWISMICLMKNLSHILRLWNLPLIPQLTFLLKLRNHWFLVSMINSLPHLTVGLFVCILYLYVTMTSRTNSDKQVIVLRQSINRALKAMPSIALYDPACDSRHLAFVLARAWYSPPVNTGGFFTCHLYRTDICLPLSNLHCLRSSHVTLSVSALTLVLLWLSLLCRITFALMSSNLTPTNVRSRLFPHLTVGLFDCVISSDIHVRLHQKCHSPFWRRCRWHP